MMSETGQTGFIDKIYDLERNEWSKLNVSLRQHGLPSVDILSSKHVSRFSDAVLLSAETSQCVRQSLVSLMRDGDRRQELVHEMIITNNQLREELKAQSQVTARHEDEINKLRILLEDSANLAQVTTSSEDMRRSTHSATAAADDDGDVSLIAQLRARCEQLRQKCDIYEREVNRLSGKLERFIREEEERRQRETHVFEHLRKKPGKERIDDTVLNIIDSYERQLYDLRRELEGDVDLSRQSATSTTHTACTPNVKTLIRAYEKSVRELKSQLKAVENEHELLKLELESRPHLKDVRESQLKVKQLERVIRTLKSKHAESFDVSRDTVGVGSTLSTDISFITAAKCRLFLKLFCEKLDVTDLEEVVPTLHKLTVTAEAYAHLEQFVKDVVHIVDSQDALKPHDLKTSFRAHKGHQVWCEETLKHVLPTLEYWSLELQRLKELWLSIKRMVDKLFPWQSSLMTSSSADCVTTSQLIETVDALIHDDDQTQLKGLEDRSDAETRTVLQGLVRHFQMLFDVPNVLGVYARMSAIYRQLSETRNILTTLKDHLDLDDSAKSSVVVDAVAALCDSRDSFVRQLTGVLQVDDVDRIVPKIEEYREFFGTFHEVMLQLMSVLGVERIDEVLPVVQSLTRYR